MYRFRSEVLCRVGTSLFVSTETGLLQKVVVGMIQSDETKQCFGPVSGQRLLRLCLMTGILFQWMLATGLAVAGITCASCGYENADSAEVCNQCNSSIHPPPEAARNMGSGSDKSTYEAVSEDVVEARRGLRSGDSETARLYARNALALNLLTASGSEREARGTAIMTLIRECDTYEPVTRDICNLCGGDGRNSCRRCGGSGRVSRRLTLDERKLQRGQAGQRYRVQQQARQRTPVGNAWLPSGLADSLTQNDAIALRRTCAAGCQTCMGFGQADCAACRGLGGVACRAAGCNQGVVKGQLDGLMGSSGLAVESVCKECRGLAVVACKNCTGSGRVLCQACNGSGIPDVCRHCSGDGLAECKRCRGTGKVRDEVCTACRGDGSDLCRYCHGTGLCQ